MKSRRSRNPFAGDSGFLNTLYVVTRHDIEKWKSRPSFPFREAIGMESQQRQGTDIEVPEYEGWEFVEEHFVDSSGFGAPGEAALTVSEFIEKLVPGRGYILTGVGQFQVKVSEYRRVKRKKNPFRKGLLPPRDNRKRIKKELQKCVESWEEDARGEEWPTLVKYAWPGGYTIIYITKQGEVICPDCAQEVVTEFLKQDDDTKYGWMHDDPVIGCQTYDEGPDEECAECSEAIESSYGDPDEEEP
jgi:hypothetical protein